MVSVQCIRLCFTQMYAMHMGEGAIFYHSHNRVKFLEQYNLVFRRMLMLYRLDVFLLYTYHNRLI